MLSVFNIIFKSFLNDILYIITIINVTNNNNAPNPDRVPKKLIITSTEKKTINCFEVLS